MAILVFHLGLPDAGWAFLDLQKFYRDNACDYDLIICVLVMKETDIWHKNIVAISDRKSGVRTCCLLYDSILKGIKEKRMKAIVDNFVYKINLKMGGINHNVQIEHLPENTMLIGADVTHQGTDDPKDTTSIAGIVFSINKDFSKYHQC